MSIIDTEPIDAGEQALVPRPAGQVIPFQTEADTFYGAGALGLTKEEQADLTAPINPNDIDILPTGEIYYSQVEYRRRLNQALGVGKWSLRPMSDWKHVGSTVCREYALFINGRFAATGLGEAEYREDNARSSWATACESAKSDALKRACKDIGIALECWDKRYAEAWKRQHATRVEGKWKRNDSTFVAGTATPRQAETSDTHRVDRPEPSVEPSSPSAVPASISGNKKQFVRLADAGKAWKHGGISYQMFKDDQGKSWRFTGQMIPKAIASIGSHSLMVEYQEEKGEKGTIRTVVEVVA